MVRSCSYFQGQEAAALTRRRVVLAQNLIVNLRDRSISKSVRDLADKLLDKLLRSFSDLLWQPELLSSLLTALDALDATGHPIAADSRISSWLQKVLINALLLHMPFNILKRRKINYAKVLIAEAQRIGLVSPKKANA